MEFVTTGTEPAKLLGKPLDDTELSIIGWVLLFCFLFLKYGLGFEVTKETAHLLRHRIVHYKTTNLGRLSMGGQIELRPELCGLGPQGHLLAVNLHRHAERIHHQFLGPPLPRHLGVGAAPRLGFPQEDPGL